MNKGKRMNNHFRTVWNIIFVPGRIVTLSNGLSAIRLLGAWPLYELVRSRQSAWALGFTLFLIFTDFADGYFARKLNQVSELGKVLDPLADKVCTALGMIALHLSYGFPLWLAAVVIGRDTLILLGSVLLLFRLPTVIPSAFPGKITVTVLSALFLAYLLPQPALQKPLEILCLVSIIFSLGYYGRVFYQKFRCSL